MNNNAIILLSGGLDSVVSLAMARKKYDIKLALFFKYGQKSFFQEKTAAENIAKFYGINIEIIDLPWLKNITNASIVDMNANVPEVDNYDLDESDIMNQTMKSVWVPNRNSLFLNIAASYCDSLNIENIIIGANKEEAATFKDNSAEFIDAENNVFEFSTLVRPKVIAPLIELNKADIIEEGHKLDIPFRYIYSCYSGRDKHCGKCESCVRLKRGLERLGLFDILKVLFVE